MTALARLFGSLANTLLDLGLPRIRTWLRDRVGPAADVAQVSTEGSFIHLDGVRLPIGERGVLVLDRATAAITPARGRGVALPEIRLHAFSGLLRFTNPESDTEARGAGDELRAEVRFAASAHAEEDAWVSGELTIVRATWSARIAREGTPLHEPMEGRARLLVTSTSWSLEDGMLTSAQANVFFAGQGATGAADSAEPAAAAAGAGAGGGAIDTASLVLDGARVGPFVDAVQAMVGRSLEVPLGVPLDARLSGDLAWDARTGGRCKLHVTAEGLDARIEGTVGGDGRSLVAHVDGTLSPAVPMRRARVTAALLPRDEDRLVLSVDATGDASRPEIRATLRATELGFRFGRPRFLPALVARAIELDVESNGDVARLRGGAHLGQAAVTVAGEVPLRAREGRRISATVADLEPTWVTSFVTALAPALRLAVEGDRAATSGDGVVFTVPRDARIACNVAVALEGAPAVTGEVVLATPRSRVALRPLAVSDKVDGTRLVGSLATVDALTLGLFPFDVRPAPSGTMVLDVAMTGAVDDLVLDGLVTSEALSIVIGSRPEVPAFEFTNVTTRLTIDRSTLRYGDGRFRAYGGSFFAEGVVPFTPAAAGSTGAPAPAPLHLQVRNASASLVEAIARLARGKMKVCVERSGPRPSNELWIPASATVAGELWLSRDLTTTAELALETAASSALLSAFVLSPAQRVDGSTIRGTLAIADALTAGAFDTTLRPLPEGAARIEATLKGPLDDCVLSGFVTVPKVRIALHEGGVASRTAPTFVVTDLSTLFRVDTAKVVWHRLEARAYAGTISSAGVIGNAGSGGFVGLQSNVSVRDVSVGHLPIDASGAMVADFARGRLALDMRFDRQGEDGPVWGRGQARLDEGAFPVLARSRAALGRYGISPPPENASAPATVNIGLHPGGWSFMQAHGAVPGCEASGDIHASFDGAVDGALVVTLSEELLASSAVLVVPSILAERLTLPVRISGPIAHPRIDADLGSCLGRFMTDNRVTALFSEAASDVVSLFTGREPTRPSAAPPVTPAPPPNSMVHARSEDALMRELVASGADWDEIEERLQEHRRGGVRHRIG